MKKVLMAIGLAVLVFVSSTACSSMRTSSPSSPSSGAGENWTSQRATQR